MKKTEKVELEAEIARLKSELEYSQIHIQACRRAHGVLSRGIKKVLRLKNWPDFYKLYGGSGMFADGVVRLLNEEIDKLRGPITERHNNESS